MRCLCARLRQTERLLTGYYEKELRSAQLTPTQFELLSVIAANRGIGQSRLSEWLCVDQTTLSRNIKVMAQRNWIARTVSREDNRRTLYALTADGRKAWRAALPHWRRAHARMRKLLGEEWQTAWAAMEALHRATPR